MLGQTLKIEPTELRDPAPAAYAAFRPMVADPLGFFSRLSADADGGGAASRIPKADSGYSSLSVWVVI